MNNLLFNKFLAGVMVLILSIGFMSCRENSADSDDETTGLTFDGEVFELAWGEIYDYGEFTEGYRNYDFIIFEKEEDFSSEEDEYNSKHAIYLWFESPGAGSFDPGTYVFSSTNIDENHLYTGEIIYFAEDDYIEVTAGEVEISISGATYTLEFDLTFEGGKELKGTLSYDFEVYDETDDGSAKIPNKNNRAVNIK